MGVREQRRAEREKRFDEYARKGYSYAQCGEIEGMEAEHAGRNWLKPAYARLGLKPPGPGPKKGVNPKEPKLDANHHHIRSRLADALNNYRHESKQHPAEVAKILNVPVKLQTKALNDPYNYDWKLSSIVKLAVVTGRTPEAFLKWLTTPREELIK